MSDNGLSQCRRNSGESYHHGTSLHANNLGGCQLSSSHLGIRDPPALSLAWSAPPESQASVLRSALVLGPGSALRSVSALRLVSALAGMRL